MALKSKWTRIVNKFVPVGLISQRRNTETILRGLFERYRGTSLEEEFGRMGITGEQAAAILDEVDEKFGAHILSNQTHISDAALNGAFLLIASLVAERKAGQSK